MKKLLIVLLAVLLFSSGCYYSWQYWTERAPPADNAEWEPIPAEG